MGAFIGTLQVEQVGEGSLEGNALWRLLQPFGYRPDRGITAIIAPAGFITDFATVPRIPLAFEVVGDLAQGPATLHDFMYSNGFVSRKRADDLLREMMQSCGYSWLQCWSVWAAVRAFGGSHYVKKGFHQ
jgi:hypothetical protein